MLFTTITQYAALAVALVAGWLFGLASHPGGRKWKERYTAERESAAAVKRDHDERLGAANARIKELEAENTRLARAAPATAATIAPRARVASDPVYDRRTTTGGWFDWRNRAGPNG